MRNSFDQPPPQSIQAEEAVLGAILIEPNSLLRANEIIQHDDFYRTTNGKIFDAMHDLFELGDPIDVITVCERLKQKGYLEECGGESYIASLAFEIPTAANVAYNARIIKNKSILRKIGAWAADTYNLSRNGVENIGDFISTIEGHLIDIAASAKSKKDPSIRSIIDRLRQFRNRITNGEIIYTAVPDFLEDFVPGFYPNFWIIGGYTGKGKSNFMNQIIVDGQGNGAKALIFTTEESADEKTNRMISNIGDISFKTLQKGNVTGYEERIEKAENVILKWDPIIYDDVRTTDEIYLLTRKHVIQDKINIVCLDYVQNLFIKNTLYETMVEASVKLFAMSRLLGITVIAVSQIDNESAKKESNIIGLKGAGELAAAADVVFWLTRVKGTGKERFIDCTIKKNRTFGDTGKVELTFSEKWNYISKRHLT